MSDLSKEIEGKSFRDSIATVDESGKRIWLYPKKPHGRYYEARKWVSYGLLAFLFAGPFIRIGGDPLLMINVLERKFVIFGQLFLPQDFFIFVFGTIMVFIFIVLFTQVYGRIFCGWVCPQTIFMEMVFRRIEYWIEGDSNRQRKLAKQPWNQEKIIKKGGKQLIFLTISFFIANTFLSYIVGSDQVIKMASNPPAENMGTFTGLVVFTALFYGVFAFFREQVCTTVCPYGRLQGVLLGKDSTVISYDYVRGEPRGKLSKQKAEPEAIPKGDCIDCSLCVQVCPTGIDIRNGTQLECVNCTACIDACDAVMDKIERPRGLIRYASENEIAENKPFTISKRHKVYSGILVVLLGIMVYSLSMRTEIETSILRAQGTRLQKTEEGLIRNLYTVQVANKTTEPAEISLKLVSPEGKITMVNSDFTVRPRENSESAFFLDIAPDQLEGRKTEIEIEVYNGSEKIQTVESTFTGPYQINYQ